MHSINLNTSLKVLEITNYFSLLHRRKKRNHDAGDTLANREESCLLIRQRDYEKSISKSLENQISI